MQNKPLVLSLFFFLIAATSSFSHTTEGAPMQKEKADSLFSVQKYTDAKAIYTSLFESGQLSGDLLLKLAYVYEGLKKPEYALYYLEKHLQHFGPNDAIRDHIIELSSEYKLSGYEQSDYRYLRAWLLAYKEVISLALLVITVLLTALLFIRKKPLFVLPLLLVALAAVFAIEGLKEKQPRAVVIEASSLRGAPSHGAEVMRSLSPGHKIKVLSQQDVWLQIDFNGKPYYIKKNKVMVL